MPEKIKYKKGMMMILVNQWINDQTKIIDEKEEVRLINLEGYIEDPDTGMMSDIQETSQEKLLDTKSEVEAKHTDQKEKSTLILMALTLMAILLENLILMTLINNLSPKALCQSV